MSLRTTVYDSVLRSRLEPSVEERRRAREFVQQLRTNGYLVVYSKDKNAAELVSMEAAVLKAQGINQRRITAEERNTFARLKETLSIDAERSWLGPRLKKAEEGAEDVNDKPFGLFNEVIRVFPGARFAERVQGNFIDGSARRPE